MDKALKKDQVLTNDTTAVKVQSLKVKKKKKKSKSLEKQKSIFGWLFILPFLLGFVLIYLPMIISSLQISFSSIEYEKVGQVLKWVGIDNYSSALGDSSNFVQTLVECLGGMAFDIPAIIIFSLFMAILLNQDMKGRAAFRAIFFVPVIVSTGIIEAIDLSNTLAQLGENVTQLGSEGVEGTVNAGTEIINAIDVERFFGQMKIGAELATVVSGWANNVYNIVNRSGVQMLIFLAALQSISPSIYESCRVEGATSWETFWKITFPMISPMILVNLVYTVIDSFTTKSNVMMSFISSELTKPNGKPAGTAMAWMYFLIVIIILAALSGIASLFVFYQRRDK